MARTIAFSSSVMPLHIGEEGEGGRQVKGKGGVKDGGERARRGGVRGER